MAPVSTSTKLFCIFYSIVGIPLTLILFTSITDRLLVRSNSLLNFLVERCAFQCSELKIKLSYVCVLMLLLSVIFIFIPAYILSTIEPGWSYLDSLYFCFISITTIGLGDYIPGESVQQSYKSIYKIIVSGELLHIIYLLFLLRQTKVNLFFLSLPVLFIFDLRTQFWEMNDRIYFSITQFNACLLRTLLQLCYVLG